MKSTLKDKENFDIGKLVNSLRRGQRALRRDAVNRQILAAWDQLPVHEQLATPRPKLPEIDTDKARKRLKDASSELKRRKIVLHRTPSGITWSRKGEEK